MRERQVGAWGGLVLGVAALLTACSTTPPVTNPTAGPTGSVADRDRLAGLAATAKDRRFVASYTLRGEIGQPDRTVTVALGTDGSWVVGVPGGALSGLADVAIYSSGAGALYQCLLGPAAGTAGSRPDLGPLTPGCVAAPRLSAANDPQVQHAFTDWIDPLTDRATALSVTASHPIPGAWGSCFSVESNSAALAPPVDPGIYCYDLTGVLTGVHARFGTLVLTGAATAGPVSVALPAPIVTRSLVPITAPPRPTPTPTPSVPHA